MLRFQPAGFGQSVVETSLGAIAYYHPTEGLWPGDSSAPALIFLHGFGGGASAYEWSHVYPAFAATHRVIAPDLLGWGLSAHPPRQYCIGDYLLSIREFIERVSETPVSIAASSLTAGLAIRLALERPELFRSLFLVGPSGFADFGKQATRRIPLSAIATPVLDRAIYAIGATNRFAVRSFLERFVFANPARVSEDMVSAYLASACQPNAEYAALAFLRGDLYFDLSRYLSKLTVPTVAIWGQEAQFVDINSGRRLAAQNPEFVRHFYGIPNTGLFPQLEQPAVVVGLLHQWLRDIEGIAETG